MTSGPNPPPRPAEPRPTRQRGNLVVFAIVAVLAGLLFWTASAIQKHNAVQNCIDSGRRDCVPLPTD